MALDEQDLALKFLELARQEILEKVQFVNQTLGAYLLGISAVVSWFYQTVQRPAAPPALPLSPADQAIDAVSLALLLAYLALGVNWIIHHNERMVAALARYQSEELKDALGSSVPMWERSEALRSEDGVGHASFTILTEEFIVLAPPFGAFLFAARQTPPPGSWAAHLGMPAALLANALNVGIGALMLSNRLTLRCPEGLRETIRNFFRILSGHRSKPNN
jgi:hypothetical protein